MNIKIKVGDNGEKHYHNDAGELHREDGPAVECTNGDKAWYLNGKRHRKNGPAVELTNGYKSWWISGKLHRENGPAIKWGNDNKEWFLFGERVTEEDIKKYNLIKELAGI